MYSMWIIMCFLNIKLHKHIALHQMHKIMFFLATSCDPFTFLRTDPTRIYQNTMVKLRKPCVFTMLYFNSLGNCIAVSFINRFLKQIK